MAPVRLLCRRTLCALVFALCSAAAAVENDPLPVPTGTTREQAVVAYNDGVKLLVEKRYRDAQARFEQALAVDEKLAEAHNNLAFSLRMQGAQNFAASLQHYNRALELKPDLAQAYMYRGVLFTQQGDLTRARADHARLLTLDKALAEKLAAVIDGAREQDIYGGISPQSD
jgi:tetratricopeptide (TPR) repeat protein